MRIRRAIPAALLLTAAILLGENGRFEKTIAFPRGTDAKLDFTYEKVTIREVQCRNYPDAEDVEKARTKDHDDHSWLWWEFHADNHGNREATIHFWVEILDAKGTSVATLTATTPPIGPWSQRTVKERFLLQNAAVWSIDTRTRRR
jgi:hypothetical protein